MMKSTIPKTIVNRQTKNYQRWFLSALVLFGAVNAFAQPSGGWDETQTIGGSHGLTDHGNGVIQLLDRTSGECSGASVHETTDLYDPTTDGTFSKCYEVYFGCPGNDVINGPDTKGDGLAFSFYKGGYDINNGLACGGGLGYMGANGQMITIEFDTWSSEGLNGFDSNYEGVDIEDEIAIHRDGNAQDGGKVFGMNPGNLEDGLEHTVCIEYDPTTGILSMTIDTTQVLNYTMPTDVRLENYFGAGGLSQSWSSGKHGATNPATVTDGADITDNVGGPLCGSDVYITSPSGGAAFSSCDGPIEITAEASPPSGNTLDSIAFFVDGVRIGVDETDPYSIIWNNPRNGSYELTAAGYYSPSGTESFSEITTVTFGGQIQLTSEPFVIDGTEENHWGNYTAIPLNQAEGDVAAPDLDATYKIAFDTDNLYILVNVTDDDVSNDGGNYWENDGVEIYIDMGNDKQGTYGADDYQYTFNFGESPTIYGTNNNNTGVVYNTGTTADGYLLEVSFPWTTLGVGMPAEDDLIGFDIIINDDDAGGGRDHRLAWNDGSYNAFSNPSLFGTQKFSECNPVDPSIIAAEVEFCEGDSVLLIADPSEPTFDYVWLKDGVAIGVPVAGDSLLWVSDSAEYQVAIDNGGGYDTSEVTQLTMITMPVADAGLDTGYCPNASGVQLIGQGGAEFAWSPGLGLSDSTISNPVATPETETTYLLTVNNGICVDTASVTVMPYTVPTAYAGEDTSVCIGDTVGLEGTGGTGFSWTPATGLSQTDLAAVDAFPTETSEYIVEVSNEFCADFDTVEVVVHELPVATAGEDVDVCAGDSAQLAATEGFTYSWSGVGGFDDVSISNPKVLVADTTTLMVVLSDANCSTSDSVTVNVMVRPEASLSENASAICEGQDSVELIATGGDSYSWFPVDGLTASNNDTVVAFPNTDTEYIVEAIIGSCSDFDTVFVTVHEVPVTVISEDIEICQGDTAFLSASGGTTYSWSPSAGLNDAGIADPFAVLTTSETYEVTVSNDNCSVTDSVTVTISPAPIADAGEDQVICTGDSVQLVASGGGIYSWEPSTGLSDASSGSPYAKPDVETTYIVTTTIGSCESTDTVVVGVEITPTVSIDLESTEICRGTTGAQLEATGADSYSWSPAIGLDEASSATPLADPENTTTYVVTGTSGICSAEDSIEVIVNDQPIAEVDIEDTAICSGNSVSITATGGTDYSWSPTTGLSDASAATTIATPEDTTTYVVTVGIGTCTSTDSVTVFVGTTPVVDATANSSTSICNGDEVSMSVTGADSYVWSPAAGLDDVNSSSPIATPSENTTYVVTGSIGDCSAQDSVEITVFEQPTAVVDTEDDTICSGNSIALSASGGPNYSWSPTTGLDDASSATPSASPDETTTYVVTVSIGSCSSTDSVEVTVEETPDVVATGSTAICEGEGPVSLSVSGADSYKWSPAAGLDDATSATPIAEASESITYSVTGTLGNCSATDIVTISVTPIPEADAGEDLEICSNGSGTQLTATGGTLAVWSPEDGLSEDTTYTPVANPTSTTEYILTVFANSCSDSDTILVTVHEAPIAEAGEDTAMCSVDEGIQLQASGGLTYSWSNDEYLSDGSIADPIANPEETTLFFVTVSDENCSATDSVMIVVNECPVDITITDVFTPNGDNTNDKWVIPGLGNYDHQVIIFNRWGNEIYSSEEYDSQPWDGTRNGEDMPYGTYYFIITAADVEYQGKLTLVR
jgi:gliding motility-associated-like protein